MATRAQIARAILLMQFLPNSPVNDRNVETVVDTFELVLSDLPVEDVDAAARQYLSVGTFFPTPGVLRETAMDLQLLAIGVPTSTEAWGMVRSGLKLIESVFCEAGALLRDGYLSQQTTGNLVLYSQHVDACSICTLGGGYREQYAHPVVAETVRLLGGRDVILTENVVADRARFVEAYREVVARERMKTAMLPEVSKFVADKKQRALGLRAGIEELVKQLSGKVQS